MKTYFLLFALLPFLDLITYAHAPKKARVRALISFTLLTLLFFGSLISAPTAYAATAESQLQVACAWKVPICALGTIFSFPLYIISLIFITAFSITFFRWIGVISDDFIEHPVSMRRRKVRVMLIMWCLITIAVILGNTVFCYYLF